MPFELIDPALVAIVDDNADALGPVAVKSRLAAAAAAEDLGALAAPLAAALANVSPVVALVAAFDVLAAAETLPPVILARFAEVCDIIAAQDFHGRGQTAIAERALALSLLATP